MAALLAPAQSAGYRHGTRVCQRRTVVDLVIEHATFDLLERGLANTDCNRCGRDFLVVERRSDSRAPSQLRRPSHCIRHRTFDTRPSLTVDLLGPLGLHSNDACGAS